MVDRDFMDRAELVQRYAFLARDLDPDLVREQLGDYLDSGVFENPKVPLVAKLVWGALTNDDGAPDPGDVNTALRAFDVAPADERQRILNGWSPIEFDRRARSVDVLATLAASAPLARVLVLGTGLDTAADYAAHDDAWQRGDAPPPADVYARQDWMPLDGDDDVRLVVREGTPFEKVRNALHAFSDELSKRWDELVADVPTGVYRRRRGQVWRVYDYRGYAEDSLLVTAENDIDRPIAFIDGFAESDDTEGLRQLAQGIAENPSLASDPRCMDLRAFGFDDSPLPTPGFLYGLKCEPADADWEPSQYLTPRPYCPFLDRQLREQAPNLSAADAVNLYEPARENGDLTPPSAPQPASKTSGEAKSTAAA